MQFPHFAPGYAPVSKLGQILFILSDLRRIRSRFEDVSDICLIYKLLIARSTILCSYFQRLAKLISCLIKLRGEADSKESTVFSFSFSFLQLF